MKAKKIILSMTESYDPYVNDVAERVNGILKQEFLLEKYNADIQTMKHLVKDTINTYNTQRAHGHVHMKTPDQMHLQREVKIKTYKKGQPYQG
ncbi:MAG: integrase core domain-containing protein [Paludibacter sp.]